MAGPSKSGGRMNWSEGLISKPNPLAPLLLEICPHGHCILIHTKY